MVETLTHPDNVMTVVVAVILFATAMTIVRPMFQRSGLESRLKSVANRREELRRRSREALAGKQSTLRHTDEGVYKNVVDRLQLSRLLEDPNIIDKLAQAGFRGPSAISRFYFFRFVSPFVLAAAAAVYLFVFHALQLTQMMRFCACFVAFFA